MKNNKKKKKKKRKEKRTRIRMINNNFNVIGKKNNQISVSGPEREIPTLGSTDNAGKSVNSLSSILCLPSGWDFLVCIENR